MKLLCTKDDNFFQTLKVRVITGNITTTKHNELHRSITISCLPFAPWFKYIPRNFCYTTQSVLETIFQVYLSAYLPISKFNHISLMFCYVTHHYITTMYKFHFCFHFNMYLIKKALQHLCKHFVRPIFKTSISRIIYANYSLHKPTHGKSHSLHTHTYTGIQHCTS